MTCNSHGDDVVLAWLLFNGCNKVIIDSSYFHQDIQIVLILVNVHIYVTKWNGIDMAFRT